MAAKALLLRSLNLKEAGNRSLLFPMKCIKPFIIILGLAARDQFFKRNRDTEIPRFPRNCYVRSMTAYTDPY